MATKLFLVICCFVLVSYVHQSYGLKCYKCDNCNDPFKKDGVQTMDCSGSCEKSKGSVGGQQGISRGCSTKQPNKCAKAKVLGVEFDNCYCDADLCNSATTSSISITVMLMAVVGIFTFRKFL